MFSTLAKPVKPETAPAGRCRRRCRPTLRAHDSLPRRLIALRRIANDESDDAPRQHDLPVVVVMQRTAVHDRDRQCERGTDDEAEENSQWQRIHLLREPPDEHSRDEALEGRTNHDTDDL